MSEEFDIIMPEKLAILVIGMAGTGKTTFVNQLSKYLGQLNNQPFIVNLDPAVQNIPYVADADIRKEVNYRELITKNKLGPNGAIMTALNLYCLQINTLIDQITASEKKIFIIDTPGQIEAFTWSASGNLISQTFSMSMPTIMVYVIDSQRCQNPNAFMSNLLFCCSIFYKLKLPLIIVFNKSDIANAEVPLSWLRDYDAFGKALSQNDNYLSTLSKQMALTIEEFYNSFNVIQISSVTQQGFEKIEESLQKAKQEYFDITLIDIKQNIKDRQMKNLTKQMDNLKQ